jgi:hypothetical protein
MIDDIVSKLKNASYTPYYVERINLLDGEEHHYCQVLDRIVKSVKIFDDFELIDKIEKPLFRLNCYAELLNPDDMRWTYSILNKLEKNDNPKTRVDALYSYLIDYHKRKDTRFDKISLVPKSICDGGYLEVKLDSFLEFIQGRQSIPNLIVRKTKELIYSFLDQIPKYSVKRNFLLKNAYEHLFSQPEYVFNLTKILFSQEEESIKGVKKEKKSSEDNLFGDYYTILRARSNLQYFVD